MKKLFQIGLLILLFIAVRAMVPCKAGPPYQKAETKCMFVPDQSVYVSPLAYAAENFRLYSTGIDAQCRVIQGDVEKSPLALLNYAIPRASNVTNLNSPINTAGLIPATKIWETGYVTLNSDERLPVSSINRTEGATRLDIGENYNIRV
jgi:hypothetical protein